CYHLKSTLFPYTTLFRSKRIKRICLQTMIHQVEHLIKNKPSDEETYRAMAMINLLNLWYSQIIIFKGDEYFTDFFLRNTDYQKRSEEHTSELQSRFDLVC